MEKSKRYFLAVVVLMVIAFPASADELDQAANTVSGYFSGAAALMYACGGIMGLIGAAKVYGKFSRGDDDVYRALTNWGGGCLFLVLSAVLLQKFFG